MEAIIIMLMVIGLNLIFYFRIPSNYVIKMPLITSISSFSLIITPLLMSPDYNIPTTPYIQLLFLLIQVIIFLFTMLEYLKIKKEKR